MGQEIDKKDGASAREFSPVERILNTTPIAITLLRDDFLPGNGRQRLVEGLDDIWRKMETYKGECRLANETPMLEEFKHDSLGENIGFDKQAKKGVGDISGLINTLKFSMRSVLENEPDVMGNMTEEEKKALLENQIEQLKRQKYPTLTRGVNDLVRTLWKIPPQSDGQQQYLDSTSIIGSRLYVNYLGKSLHPYIPY